MCIRDRYKGRVTQQQLLVNRIGRALLVTAIKVRDFLLKCRGKQAHKIAHLAHGLTHAAALDPVSYTHLDVYKRQA